MAVTGRCSRLDGPETAYLNFLARDGVAIVSPEFAHPVPKHNRPCLMALREDTLERPQLSAPLILQRLSGLW